MPTSWLHQWYNQAFVVPLTQRRDTKFVDTLNQWFAFNTCITCLQLDASWADGAFNGQAGLILNLHFTKPYGIRYFASEFRGSASSSAAEKASAWFTSNGWAAGVLMVDITPPETRYLDQDRLLVIYCRASELLAQDFDMKRGAISGNAIAANSAAGAADAIAPLRNNFLLYNLSANPWPAGVAAPAFKLSGYNNVWGGIAPCCFPAVASDPTYFYEPECANPLLCGTTDTFTVTNLSTTPPPPFTTSTTPPVTEPPYTETETTTDPPPEVEQSCHHALYECVCDSAGDSSWSLVLNECIANSLCTDFFGDGETPSIACDDESFEYWLMNGCPTDGEPVPDAPPTVQNDGEPCEPSCCDENNTCHEVNYICEYSESSSGGESIWVKTLDICVPNDECSDNGDGTPVIMCDGTFYEYQLINGCVNNEKPAAPTPNCDAECEPETCGGNQILFSGSDNNRGEGVKSETSYATISIPNDGCQHTLTFEVWTGNIPDSFFITVTGADPAPCDVSFSAGQNVQWGSGSPPNQNVGTYLVIGTFVLPQAECSYDVTVTTITDERFSILWWLLRDTKS